jgi:hypothetical protein
VAATAAEALAADDLAEIEVGAFTAARADAATDPDAAVDTDAAAAFCPPAADCPDATPTVADPGAPGAPASPDSSGSSVSSNSSNPSRSSASFMKAVLAGAPCGVPEAKADAAASFRAANKRSGSLVPSRLSGSINSSIESSVLAVRDSGGAEPPEGEGATPTDAPSSMGASTGRSASGSKTGRDAASIISSLVDASSNTNQHPRNRHDSMAGFRGP